MPESDLIRRQRETLRSLIALAGERDHAELETEQSRAGRVAATQREYDNQKKATQERYASRSEQAKKDKDAHDQNTLKQARDNDTQAKADFSKASRKIASDFETARETARKEYQQASWEITTLYESGEKTAKDRLNEESRRLRDASIVAKDLREDLQSLLASYTKFPIGELPAGPLPEDRSRLTDPIATLFDRLSKLDEQLRYVERLLIPRALKGWRETWLYLLPLALLIYPMIQLMGKTTGSVLAVILAAAAGVGLRIWLAQVARNQLKRHALPVAQGLLDADSLAAYAKEWSQNNYSQKASALSQTRDSDLTRVKKRHNLTIQEAESTRDEKLRLANSALDKRILEIEETRRRELEAAHNNFKNITQEIETEFQDNSRLLDQRYRATLDAVQDRYQTAFAKLQSQWNDGINQSWQALSSVNETSDSWSPRWNGPAELNWVPPEHTPNALRYGQIDFSLNQIPKGVPRDLRLREQLPKEFPVPALLSFPDASNLVVEASGPAGRQASLDLLQALMLRLLVSLPPGKVRFIILDPVDLGRNFSAFMHLADDDPALVSQRIWTEPEQIEERLADLSEHIEKVIQNLLRNEYATIEQYNAQAGELAEPFRVLVVADFPTHFDDRAAYRLQNIVASGVRCGVLALIMVDRDRPLPSGFDLADLREHATCLSWNGSRLALEDPDFGKYPLLLDSLPNSDLTTRLLRQVGAAAKAASRVEVPFDFIAPKQSAYWTGDCRAVLEVPLGKAGAYKLQYLRLGQGTSQHALVAGRTGSGKSTLFHALITNIALTYSPNEVELYLIDFKKGVEFKTYAANNLPHARVVAIESEREFGISVLQRLDGLLRERADLFRDAGVQDLAAYRSLPDAKPMPRALLIVDEFQEFFVEDDKLAQEAALLLDRLVRQGRAFGVHTVLGSQTLGGAFSLARSTLGQMAVRIALQCSESDAHLILSEENSAAALLSRPGEAVYNNANGDPEGNNFFQVVWLDEAHRENYLRTVSALAHERFPGWNRKPIVFEGNVPGQIESNPLLQKLLSDPAWPDRPRAPLAWLGDAVAIKDPTAAVLRRQGGAHLLIVGQNDEAALGVQIASLISLAAQFPPSHDQGNGNAKGRKAVQFHVLDATPEDSPLAGQILQYAGSLPQTTATGSHRDVPRIVNEIAAELEKRQQADTPNAPEIFLLIHDIGRFRDLRKREDDFSFSRRDDDAPSPSDQLVNILREGPLLGIHVLCWCDSLTNLQRTFDRQSLREFEQRVLFQMSPSDSSHLIDSPQASRLGPFRALFSWEEEGIMEKFRPYGPPPPEWSAWVRQRLQERLGTLDAPSTS